jgi:hypothetical protein
MSGENSRFQKISLQHFKGLCTCGEPYDAQVRWFIDAGDSRVLSSLQNGMERQWSRTCIKCSHTTNGLYAVLVDLPKDQALLVCIPESLAFQALYLQGQLLQALSAEGQVKTKAYFHQPEIIIGDDALSARLNKPSSSYPLNIQSSRSLKSQAPVIAPIPESLQGTSVDALELSQELAESPTQVIRPKTNNKDATHSQLSTKTGSLDALIDSALEDQTSVNDKVEIQKNAVKEQASSIVIASSRESVSSVKEDKSAKQNEQTAISVLTPTDEPEPDPKEPTRLLYAQNMKRFDPALAEGRLRYINVIDGSVELSAKIDERHAENWITDQLDVRIQLHRELQLGAPCITLFTVQDGRQQDELYWPIYIDGSLGPKALRSLRKQFRFELILFKPDGKFYGQRVIEAPLEENSAYIINFVKQMGMTSSNAAKARAVISAEDFDREGQMKHPFYQESFSEVASAKDALLAVSIWSYWSTVRQRDYLIFVKSFPIPWLRRLQHRVLKSAIEFGIHMPINLQSQAVALGLAKSDVELLQKSMTHFVEVNVNFRLSNLDPAETWENWDALLAQLSEMGIDADEEVEQLAFQAMQKAGVDLEFEEDDLTGADPMPHPVGSKPPEDAESFDESFEDLSDISEISDLSDIPPPITPNLQSEFTSENDADLIMEDFIEEEYLTDLGEDSILLIDDTDIVEEDIVDPVTAKMGQKLSQTTSLEIKTQMFVSKPKKQADKGDSSVKG